MECLCTTLYFIAINNTKHDNMMYSFIMKNIQLVSPSQVVTFMIFFLQSIVSYIPSTFQYL